MYLRRPLDFESMSDTVYNVTVEATDGELNSSAVVTITITDVNDNVPECTPIFVNVTIDEDMRIGSRVTHFTTKELGPRTAKLALLLVKIMKHEIV